MDGFVTGSILVVVRCAAILGNADSILFLTNALMLTSFFFLFFFFSVSYRTRLGYIFRTFPRVFLYFVCILSSPSFRIWWLFAIGVAIDIVSLNFTPVPFGLAVTVGFVL